MTDLKKIWVAKGLRFKFIATLLVIAIVPLVIYSGITAWHIATNMQTLETHLAGSAKAALTSFTRAQDIGVDAGIREAEAKSGAIVEMRARALARQVSAFLYQRDRDIRYLAFQTPDPALYQSFFHHAYQDVAVGRFSDNETNPVPYQNSDNSNAWKNHPAQTIATRRLPLYHELTYIDLQGMEKIKINQEGLSENHLDVSDPNNTFCKAETYFSNLAGLQKGEIYVSRVIGAYQRGWLVTDSTGNVSVKTGSAYAGKENRDGKPFQGIVRWCTPVYDKNEKIGYLTLALDHTHLMAFTDHCPVLPEMTTDMDTAASGNYAAMWDVDGQCISHPRDFFISGFDPQTGERVPGWVSEQMYTDFKQSSLPLDRFIAQLPPFRQFSLTKSGSTAQRVSGEIPLDCKVLDFAPQCEGWYQGTVHGGSGSFKTRSNTMQRLTGYAAIPYKTGDYSASDRGFGIVTFGLTLETVHHGVEQTREMIEKKIAAQAVAVYQDHQKNAALLAQQTGRLYLSMAMMGLVMVILVVALSLKAGKQLTMPLETFTRAVEDSHAEAGTTPVALPAIDEQTRRLADVFNGLLKKIADIDRTKNSLVEDLEKANERLKVEIDERSETEKALRDNEERYRNIFENIMDIYYRTDNNGIITLVSPSAVDFFGYECVDEIIGKPVAEAFYQKPEERQLLVKAMALTGYVKNFTVYLKKKDNTKVILETCSQYIYDENRQRAGIEGVLHDVTEVKKVEEELKKSNNVLNDTIETLTNTQKQLVEAEKMASLGNLVAGVAHEINTPVGICVTAASFLQEKTNGLKAFVDSGYYVKEDLIEFCRSAEDASSMIMSNLYRASELITSFKKVAVDQSTEDKRVFNVKRYINEVLISIRPKYKHCNHSFTINCPDDLTVYSYPGAFFQIISNLIMNSLIHGFSDTSGGQIGFDISYDGTDFIFIYSDNGMGMDEDSIKRVFEPFFTTRRGMGGTGLGMNIVYNLVTMKLNGRITCDSMLGEGTSFFIAISENDAFKVDKLVKSIQDG